MERTVVSSQNSCLIAIRDLQTPAVDFATWSIWEGDHLYGYYNTESFTPVGYPIPTDMLLEFFTLTVQLMVANINNRLTAVGTGTVNPSAELHVGVLVEIRRKAQHLIDALQPWNRDAL
jgi:hypothetical protein